MDLAVLAELLREAVRRKEFVVLVADCEVVYEGRSASKLGRGERLIIIKQDHSVIVHRPVGYEPVNWQPPGSLLSVAVDRGKLIIRCVRKKPHEVLSISAYGVRRFFAERLRDNADFSMWGNEEDIKHAIMARPDLVEEGLKVLDEEWEMPVGFADVLAEDQQGNLVIIEIKRHRAGIQAVQQLKRYVDYAKRLGRRVRGILVAPGISREARSALEALGLEFKRISPETCYRILKQQGGLEDFI